MTNVMFTAPITDVPLEKLFKMLCWLVCYTEE